MTNWFGTDGIRGVAGRDLHPENVTRIGRAAARVMADEMSSDDRRLMLFGRDSRLSGEMLCRALTSSFLLEDYSVWDAGILPTPVLAFLTRKYPVSCGIMVTASHNPVRDNGIKIFRTDGFKLSDDQEARIEELIESDFEWQGGDRTSFGEVIDRTDLVNDYREVIRDHARIEPFSGEIEVALDCSYGATAELAPRIFTEWGARLDAIGDRFDGSRINVECGATNPEKVARVVREQEADLGFAFDGDGDRVVAVDHRGRAVDGDRLIALLAREVERYADQKKVVVTDVSNLGMEEYLTDLGYRVDRTDVGDANVLSHMVEIGADLGGEQSGHIILRDITTTGDGPLVALTIASLVVQSGVPLCELIDEIPLYPQRMTSPEMEDKLGWQDDESFQEDLDALSDELDEKNGRLFVRPSGTEPKVRILVEAEEQSVVEEYSDRAEQLFRDWDRETTGAAH